MRTKLVAFTSVDDRAPRSVLTSTFLALLRITKTNVLAIKLIFGRAEVAAANHRLAAAKLPARDKPHGAATRARHDGYVRVLGMSKRGLVFKDEDRARIHSFGNPFFQELQIG